MKPCNRASVTKIGNMRALTKFWQGLPEFGSMRKSVKYGPNRESLTVRKLKRSLDRIRPIVSFTPSLRKGVKDTTLPQNSL